MKANLKHITIALSETLPKSIASRSAIENVFNIETDKVQAINVNFEDISFISRSVSHQLIHEKRKLEKENIKVTFVKMSAAIKEMIDTVTNALNKPKEIIPIQYKHFSSRKDFQDFLMRR